MRALFQYRWLIGAEDKAIWKAIWSSSRRLLRVIRRVLSGSSRRRRMSGSNGSDLPGPGRLPSDIPRMWTLLKTVAVPADIGATTIEVPHPDEAPTDVLKRRWRVRANLEKSMTDLLISSMERSWLRAFSTWEWPNDSSSSEVFARHGVVRNNRFQPRDPFAPS